MFVISYMPLRKKLAFHSLLKGGQREESFLKNIHFRWNACELIPDYEGREVGRGEPPVMN